MEGERPRRFRPYRQYKVSGVEWLGEVPAHWDVERLKYLATLNDEALPEATDPNLEMNYVDISSVDAVSGITGTDTIVFEKAPSRARRVVRCGDVILSTVRTYLRAIAAIEASESNLIVSTGFAVVRPWRLDSSFASYALRAPHFVERVVANSVGVSYPAINASSLACFPIPYPEVDEQRVIADFLDRETAKIDALVARKERLIELLQEKRTALITRAVTRGLDPNVPMKDSGVEWLGEIPTHWKVCRLRRIVSKFVDYRGKTPDKSPSGARLVTAKNIKNQLIDFSLSEEFIPEDLYPQWMIRGRPERGDVLITTEAPLGETAQVLDADIALAQRIILLKVNTTRVTNDYLKYHFAADPGRMELGTRATGSTALGIKASHLKASLVAVPPVCEQEEISRTVDSGTVDVDLLIAKVHQAIDHLKEFRTTLISAAVTGKIDVRETLPR